MPEKIEIKQIILYSLNENRNCFIMYLQPEEERSLYTYRVNQQPTNI